MLKEQNRLLTLDGEKPVANLVESVVRHLRVHGTREMLKNDAEKKAARAKKAAEDKAAREYLEGATIKLAEGLHNRARYRPAPSFSVLKRYVSITLSQEAGRRG